MGTRAVAVFLIVACAACSRPPAESAANPSITVAAASNLTGVFEQMGRAFTQRTGINVVFSYGATAVLAQQIDSDAPFDVFAAADATHLDSLVRTGKIAPPSRAVYARGQLALWIPQGAQTGVRALQDLTAAQVRFIAIAQPSVAPYGQAAVEALKSSGLWDQVQPKVVYAENINQAKQFGASGNADAAFTAYSLVLYEAGTVIQVDPKLYRPIDQALGVIAASRHFDDALQFTKFVLGPEGRSILRGRGYDLP
jgi:molybdate transport system substrate-binding protein